VVPTAHRPVVVVAEVWSVVSAEEIAPHCVAESSSEEFRPSQESKAAAVPELAERPTAA
jgi:hypothetical protein